MHAPGLSPAPRLYCEATPMPGTSIELPERAARHVEALRLRAGESVTLFCGDGHESAATLTSIERRRLMAVVRDRIAVDRESPLIVHLAPGLSTGDRMDFIVQKATELGVSSIQPVVTNRSIVRLSTERRERRTTHWQNVVIAACEQCGRNRIPPVRPNVSFGNFLARHQTDGARVLLAPEGSSTIRAVPLPQLHVTLLVGPEGGLAFEEQQLALAAGFTPVRFGPRVLRTETAPLAALAALQALYGDC
jgi:16S rRNA (uracil1498-N3)-methyltransferase